MGGREGRRAKPISADARRPLDWRHELLHLLNMKQDLQLSGKVGREFQIWCERNVVNGLLIGECSFLLNTKDQNHP